MKNLSAVLLFCLLLYACNTTKFVPEGEYLFNKVEIESDIPGYKSGELKPYLKQQPNYKMLGINKTMLQLYSLSGRDSTNWLNRLIRKSGEAPVIFDSMLVAKTDSELRKFFVNKGYIHVDVASSISRSNKKANVVYRITGNAPYRIRNYAVSMEDSVLKQTLFGGINGEPWERLRGEGSALRTPQVKEGMLFDRNLLDAERTRLTTLLQNRGYFNFGKENISYDADSSLNAQAVDLELKFRPQIYRKSYYDKVYIYLDYNPLRVGNIHEYPKTDSIVSEGYTLFYQGKQPSLRTKTLLDNSFIVPGRQYSQMREELTYSSFSNLHALNNVHIQFEAKERNDSSLIDSYILTMPARKQAISYSIEGTNTAGDLGVATSIHYTHRNLFRGSETFNLRLRGAYEAMTNLLNPYLELGGEASIHIPKFLFPFLNRSFSRRMNTSTEFSVSYNNQMRQEYDRILLSGGVHYQWRERTKLAARHQFDLLDIDYIYLPRVDTFFLGNLPKSAQYFGYTNQFIVGMSYSYYQTTLDPLLKQRNAYSFRFSLESAGNALAGLSLLFDWKKDDMGTYQLFNTRYAQFVKSDLDYSNTIVFDKHNSFAWRIGGGIIVPYGNSVAGSSDLLPFEKKYYSGGANSVRAWAVRELGPGNYVPNASTTFYHQSGNIKLDANIEYRSRFFWKFEAAAFIDAGNIWTLKAYEGQEGGEFRFDTFYRQIAIGYGLGLRLDFDYFLIRFDCGEKAYDPAKAGKDRWAILRPNFKENFAWHIAVGYPF